MLSKKLTKKDKKHLPKKKYSWWLLPITGLIALIWYVLRVVPKPSRAAYPCQRVAAPLAGGFVIWFIGILSSITLFRKTREFFKQSRLGQAIIYSILVLIVATITIIHIPNRSINATDITVNSQSNDPIGTAKGIFPGRVVWVYDPAATDWEGYYSSQHWWESNHTDIKIVEKMLSKVIRGITGKSTNAAAWSALFKHQNQLQGKGYVDYLRGEKIVIKLNMVTCIAKENFVDPNTYNKDPSIINRIDTSPQGVLALLRQLVNVVGVNQSDITVGDPTALFPNCYWNILHPEFPNVHYWDNLGGSGRTRAEFSNVPFYWSTTVANGKRQDYLPEAVAEADYLIDFAVLKGHSSGVTLCAKNHYGTLIRCPDGHLRDEGILDYYNTHLSLPNAAWSPGMGKYRSLVDLMGHPKLGGKTLLYLIDGLYAGYYWDAQPRKWTMAPFGNGETGDWPSSLFGSLDPVAIDSVAYDFLLNQWPEVVTTGGGPSLQGGAEDYLHEAAQANNPPSGTKYDPDKDGKSMQSQGVHEHWNNATDKMYSRNLGTGNGIELFRIYNLTGSTSKITTNRTQLNFAYVVGQATLPSQTFNIANSAAGESSWTVDKDISWISCTPTSGNNAATISVTVDPQGKNPGNYSGAITITNLNSNDEPLTITVNLKVFRAGSDSSPFGSFDTPVHNSTVQSSIAVTGWVLDDVAVENVKIYRQSGNSLVYIGDAVLVEGARPDVEAAYPEYPFNYKAGWGYMMLTNFLPNSGNGTFTLLAKATDSSNHQVSLGTKTITCDNAHAVKPFGAIDTPSQGGTADGTGFINWGWALTPQPNSIPVNGTTINVWVDGVNVGHPVYNKYRSDIAALFPGYANSNGAAGYFYLNTTNYSNGVHTIQWTVTDNAGNSDGIGSRYFNVQNSGTNRSSGQSNSYQYTGDTANSQPLLSMNPSIHPQAIQIITGYNQNQKPQIRWPDQQGNVPLHIQPMERVELHLPIRHQWQAYQLVGNCMTTLPIGTTFDQQNGIVFWQPGPGFMGTFQFVFVSTEENQSSDHLIVQIKILPPSV